jgi:hypothetical protein
MFKERSRRPDSALDRPAMDIAAAATSTLSRLSTFSAVRP